MRLQKILTAALALCLLLAAGALASGEPEEAAGVSEEAPVSAEPSEEPFAEGEAMGEDEAPAEPSPWDAARLLQRLVGGGASPAPDDDRNGDGAVDPADAALMLPPTGKPADPPGPAETPTPTGTPAPPFDADAFAWNGATELWAVASEEAADEFDYLDWILRDYMRDDGWTLSIRTAGSAAEQEKLLREAASTGTAGAVLLRPMDMAALRDAALDAQRAGVVVVYIDAEPDYPVAGYMCHDWPLAGRYGVLTADNWAAEAGADLPLTEDGFAEAVIVTGADSEAARGILCGAREAFEDTDVLTLAAEAAAGPDPAALLRDYPSCRVFIACDTDTAPALAEAIGAYCAGTGGSLADYCVIACGVRDEDDTEPLFEAFSAAKEDAAASAVKGYALCGDILEARGCILFSPLQQQGLRIVNIIQSACGAPGYSLPYGSACRYSVFYSNTLGDSNLPVRGGLRPPVDLEDEPAEDDAPVRMTA